MSKVSLRKICLMLIVSAGLLNSSDALRSTMSRRNIPSRAPKATTVEPALDLENVPEEGTMFNSVPFKVIDFIMSIPVIHDVMFGVYRKQIVQKAEKMGLEWTEFMDEQVILSMQQQILHMIMTYSAHSVHVFILSVGVTARTQGYC